LPEAIVKLGSEVSTLASAALEQLAFQRSVFRNVLADVHEITARPAQDGKLLGGLDALGDHLRSQRMCDFDNGAHDGGVLRLCGDGGDQRAVDLDARHRQLPEPAQVRMAGAEIVDREPYAQPR
jgi:hypothetical protein